MSQLDDENNLALARVQVLRELALDLEQRATAANDLHNKNSSE